ncbi:versican core protein-like [Solea senegalensis]|uniref:Versican core protein-like n=1 Tax=Solea senegalensis TaxID=28829 RepID=A0AAV6SYE0_SOLSE|nr:versican core protein-like [Solea senegalensis]
MILNIKHILWLSCLWEAAAATDSNQLSIIRPVTGSLSQKVNLPCFFSTIPTTAPVVSPNGTTVLSRDYLRIKWVKMEGDVESTVLVAQNGVIKIGSSYRNRVSVPSHPEDVGDASLTMVKLRASDAGTYRCEVIYGIEDTQDTVNLDVDGVVFHYRASASRYTLDYQSAVRACQNVGATIATHDQLRAAHEDGFDQCDAGWIADQTVRYPIIKPRAGCYGNLKAKPGIRSYGVRKPTETYDVYCYVDKLDGEVFFAPVTTKMTLDEAREECAMRSSVLASPGQLHAAWRKGLDRCDYGWLSDGSVRHPVAVPRLQCGGGLLGVRTMYRYRNQTGFPEPTKKLGAYCFKGKREVISHTSFVEVSMVEMTSTVVVSSTSSIPLLESSTSTLTPKPETASEADESPLPSDVTFMFSASMAPPRPTPAGEEEELFTTVEPTIREEPEESHHPVSAELKYTTESTAIKESDAKDQSVINIVTIQPDVQVTVESLGTKSMFVIGKTEETIPGDVLTTAMTYDLSDSPTGFVELTSEEAFSSSESTDSPNGLHSTTPFPDYDLDEDEIDPFFGVEAQPPTPPSEHIFSSTPLDGTKIPTALPPDTTYMCNTRPASDVSRHTEAPEETQTTTPRQDEETPAVVDEERTSAAILTESGHLAEEATSSTSVFDESTYQGHEHSVDSMAEDTTVTDAEPEFFTAVAHKTSTPGPAFPDERSNQVTQTQNVSVGQVLLPQSSLSPAISPAPDQHTPTHGEPVLQSGDPDLVSQGAVTLTTPTVSFINGKQEITLEPQSPGEKEAIGTQIMTNVTISDEVFDYQWNKLPVDSSTDSIEEPTEGGITTEIPNVDEYDTDTISVVESKPPLIFPQEDDITKVGPTHEDSTSLSVTTVEGTSKTTEAGPAAIDGTSYITIVSAGLASTATPAEPQVTKTAEESQTIKADQETTTIISASVQDVRDESRRTPTSVKSDSLVTQTEKDEDLVTRPTEIHTARYTAETTEETKSTSATPAAEDSTQSKHKTASHPSTDDADDSESSTQGVEDGKETRTPEEFAFSTTTFSVSESSAPPGKTAKTEITPALDVESTESSSGVAHTLAGTSEGTVISQAGHTVSQLPSISPTEKAATDAVSSFEDSSRVQGESTFGTSPPSRTLVTKQEHLLSLQ